MPCQSGRLVINLMMLAAVGQTLQHVLQADEPFHAYTGVHCLARVRQAYTKYDTRIGKSWRLIFHRPTSHMAERFLKLAGPLLDTEVRGPLVNPIPPACNCTYWDYNPTFHLNRKRSGLKPQGYGMFGAFPVSVAMELVAYHLDGVLGTNIVPKGNLFSMSLDEWAAWFTEHVCCSPQQIHTHFDQMPRTLRAYGWLTEVVDFAEMHMTSNSNRSGKLPSSPC